MKFIFSSRTERFGAVESSKMLVIPKNSITFDAVFLYLKIPAYVRGDYDVCSSIFFAKGHNSHCQHMIFELPDRLKK